MSRTEWRPSDGVEGALEMLDGPTELAVDRVPTVDQTDPVASYQDWKREDTYVISCCIANNLYPGKRYESRAEALRMTQLVHGRILEANYTPGRAFFRVLRVKKSQLAEDLHG